MGAQLVTEQTSPDHCQPPSHEAVASPILLLLLHVHSSAGTSKAHGSLCINQQLPLERPAAALQVPPFPSHQPIEKAPSRLVAKPFCSMRISVGANEGSWEGKSLPLQRLGSGRWEDTLGEQLGSQQTLLMDSVLDRPPLPLETGRSRGSRLLLGPQSPLLLGEAGLFH